MASSAAIKLTNLDEAFSQTGLQYSDLERGLFDKPFLPGHFLYELDKRTTEALQQFVYTRYGTRGCVRLFWSPEIENFLIEQNPGKALIYQNFRSDLKEGEILFISFF